MEKEKILTKNNYVNVLHPLFLTLTNIKTNDYAILLEKKTSNNIKQISGFSFSNEKNMIENMEILKSIEIDDYFFSNKFFLLCNFEIETLDDVFVKLDEMLITNRKLKTISYILNIIFDVFYEKIDDVYINKFVEFYIKYFEMYYSVEIEYKKIFNEINNIFKKGKVFDLNEQIINNILQK